MKLLDSDNLKMADQKGRINLGGRFAGKRFLVREQPDGSAVLTPVVVLPEHDSPLTAGGLRDQFAGLESLGDNWDGRGSAAPRPECVEYAREVVALLQSGAIARGLKWQNPHVGVNERGQITLEWWRDERTLTVFVRSENQVDYLKSWGSNIDTEMEDGELTSIRDFTALSQWLYGPESSTVDCS